MRLLVQHHNRIEFERDVEESVMDVRLGPLDDAQQRVRRFQLRWEPQGHVRRYGDAFGNVAHLLTSMRTHPALQVTTEMELETLLRDPFEVPVDSPPPLGPVELADALHPSALVPSLEALSTMAQPFAELPPFEAAHQLMAKIHREFEYQAGVRTLRQRLPT